MRRGEAVPARVIRALEVDAAVRLCGAHNSIGTTAGGVQERVPVGLGIAVRVDRDAPPRRAAADT